VTTYEEFQQAPAASAASSPESDFRALAQQFCELVKLDASAVDKVTRGDVITIDGVSMSIVLNTTFPGAPAVTLFVEMGAPPIGGEAAVLRMLLQRNFQISMERGPSFCISSTTGRVLKVAHFDPRGLSAGLLHESVQKMVDQALDWRATYFLWAPQSAAASN